MAVGFWGVGFGFGFRVSGKSLNPNLQRVEAEWPNNKMVGKHCQAGIHLRSSENRILNLSKLFKDFGCGVERLQAIPADPTDPGRPTT